MISKIFEDGETITVSYINGSTYNATIRPKLTSDNPDRIPILKMMAQRSAHGMVDSADWAAFLNNTINPDLSKKSTIVEGVYVMVPK